MPFTEDMSVFFNPDEFASEVSVTSGAASGQTFNANFGEDYFQDEFGQVDMSGTSPYLECDPADLANIARGDGLSLDGHSFTAGRRERRDGLDYLFLKAVTA